MSDQIPKAHIKIYKLWMRLGFIWHPHDDLKNCDKCSYRCKTQQQAKDHHKWHNTKKPISDRRDRIWTGTCYHEINPNTGKECGRLCDEDTGECPKGHGRSDHLCHTTCCMQYVSGNHKYCIFHRRLKVKSICKITGKIGRRYRSMMWGRLSKKYSMDNPEHKKIFNDWAQKQYETTYDPEITVYVE